MVEDSLDGRRLTWQLWLRIAQTGVRERGHQARLAGQRASVRLLRAPFGQAAQDGFRPETTIMLARAELSSMQSGPFGHHVRKTVRWAHAAGIPQLSLLLITLAIPFFVLPFAWKRWRGGTTSLKPEDPRRPRWSRGKGTMEQL
jgi:hypothetical protein